MSGCLNIIIRFWSYYRFLHDPKATEGFVGSALFANMYRFFKTDKGDWAAEKVIDIPNKEVRRTTYHFQQLVKYN